VLGPEAGDPFDAAERHLERLFTRLLTP
jgi:hypothetical protein